MQKALRRSALSAHPMMKKSSIHFTSYRDSGLAYHVEIVLLWSDQSDWACRRLKKGFNLPAVWVDEDKPSEEEDPAVERRAIDLLPRRLQIILDKGERNTPRDNVRPFVRESGGYIQAALCMSDTGCRV